MGKKLSEASLKISRNQKQQFSSLIKVLRPKVYITDSSSFKKLVQELTGNNVSSTTISSSSSPTLEPTVDRGNCRILGDEVQTDHLKTSFDAFEVSATSSEATTSSSSDQFCCYNQTCLDDTILGGSEANQTLDHLLAYQNLESLLFDAEVDRGPLYNCYAQTEQEVNIYDYELWGLL